MKADVFCPHCSGYLITVDPDKDGYKTIVKVCPCCKKGVQITYGNGRLEKE